MVLTTAAQSRGNFSVKITWLHLKLRTALVCRYVVPHLFEGCKRARIVLLMVSAATSFQRAHPLLID
jgi:hypothetical protein